ncbi:MAG: response regulator transcription factor [Roseiarcus sp.]|jgi:DNA-binding response OmpR family regulator
MRRPTRILVVDDEPAVREVLRQGLEGAGFSVLEAMDKAEMFRALDDGPIDLITLDLGLGDSDGLELALQIRAVHNIPIVMITGRSAPVDRVKGLERGADDYVSKPFHLAEVALRIRNVLRRYEREPATPENGPAAPLDQGRRYAFDSGVLDTRKREFRDKDGALVDLTETEFRLLEIFLRHPAQILTRDEIMHELRSREWSPLDRTMDGHVARLRRKIEPPSETSLLIKSVRGVGYVFTGEVSSV